MKINDVMLSDLSEKMTKKNIIYGGVWLLMTLMR